MKKINRLYDFKYFKFKNIARRIINDEFDYIDIFNYFSGYEDGVEFIDVAKKELGKYFDSKEREYIAIINYIIKKKIGRIYMIDEEILKNNNIYFSGKLLERKDIEVIIDYMKNNNLPMINYVYCYFLAKYIKKHQLTDEGSIQKLIKLPIKE